MKRTREAGAKDPWGKIIYSWSKEKQHLKAILLEFISFCLMAFLSLGIFYGNYLIGIVGMVGAFIMLTGIWDLVREILDGYAHFDVYENGIWVPIPTYWFWQKRPPKERYFRHFDDILDVKTEDMGWRSGVSFRINTKSEGEIFFVLDRKPGLKFKEELEKAIEMYRNGKTKDREL